MTSSSATSWVKFFTTAGIPSNLAASYAYIFVENRIQMNMLMDLNKEYLREMGIQPMGDIIAILKHAKTVHEKNLREKIVSNSSAANKVPVAAVQASTVLSSKVVRISPNVDDRVGNGSAPDRPLKNTKITFRNEEATTSAGETIKSAFKVRPMASDKEAAKARSTIFDRMRTASSGPVVTVDDEDDDETSSSKSITPKKSASIFSRLGDKSDGHVIRRSSLTGILKNSPQKAAARPVVRKMPQKVLLVKKIPAKATLDLDAEDERMDVGDSLKMVSFSSEDEVVEFSSPRTPVKSPTKFGVKARLGMRNDRIDAALHTTKKNVLLKATAARKVSSPMKRVSGLRSDEILRSKNASVSVRDRLNLSVRPRTNDTISLSNRLQRFSLDSVRTKTASTIKRQQERSPSVFNRLGYNRK